MGVDASAFLNPFTWHTSSVDWCEANYHVSPYVAEFWNTVSNLPFVIGSVIAMYLAWPHREAIGYGLFSTYFLLFVVGVGSMYFHATLSFAGQMVDEWAIIWLVMLCVYAYLPNEYSEAIGLKGERARGFAVGFFTLAVTIGPYVLGPDFAVAMAPLMMVAGIFAVGVIVREAFRHRQLLDANAQALLRFSVVSFFAALTCWLVDKLLCHRVHEWPVELHAMWHLLVYASGHTTLTYLAYMRVVMFEKHRMEPDIYFFPRKKSRMGLPHLHISYKGERSPNTRLKAM